LLHIFSSDLQRAALTAQAIVDARQLPQAVVQLADLRERDFRSTEGVKIGTRTTMGPGGNPHPDAETHAEMTVRVERFIDMHLGPVLGWSDTTAETGVVAVVAHGIILNVLLRSLLTRFAPAELAKLVKPGPGRSEWLASWSNTGYLEAVVTSEPAGMPPSSTGPSGLAPLGREVRLRVMSMNNTDHLQGLRKTRGGIGSAKFDTKQKTMDSFFKPVPKRGG
jgi:probable phosphoglycerate mutase